ncbi:alpha-hydroxy acid oxidase [Flavilitoribacter nigricans]|uniref:Alpha-hydroxy-acid oxidizing enzyme n=1 Tax=Flavilitoribacter nigricans (strain ATCC 23147 / DSM 23189 / NBRC 102662 / NCIMB 1420 / SS-2) TaxID=1122177 RepID=A0A2D0NE63_FLAN2|nr:alpha-hydroxy acid oxidase [Flavilitoribacter nigricans]PHN06801.1 alpha-hydroxy-acid oxidizing enzyme [Flavilitoribacter nigricans DSM 23189 = NBRC 102662]
MSLAYNPKYPSIPDLRARARKRIPRFAFEYVDGGCNAEINLRRNTEVIREVQLKPYYLRDYGGISLETELFGHRYSAPFGISPIGLQGLIWPEASEILARAAFESNIPFILSTVATASLEKISEITEGQAWFQLYHPVEEELRDDLLQRLEAAGYNVLVILSDVPTFGYRSKEIKNGLAIPPKMTLRNMLQIAGRPSWAIRTLLAGTPEFKTLKPYIPKGMSLRHLGLFMNKTFSGRLNADRVKALRDRWKGKLVIKGVASEEDARKAIEWGLDGIIVSNHGGRQLDAGEAAITPLTAIAKKFGDQLPVMMDSGIRSGPDIANVMASGADFTFLGRSFMYGVGALGREGGQHTINMLKVQLQQVMEQVCCETPRDLRKHLIGREGSGERGQGSGF